MSTAYHVFELTHGRLEPIGMATKEMYPESDLQTFQRWFNSRLDGRTVAGPLRETGRGYSFEMDLRRQRGSVGLGYHPKGRPHPILLAASVAIQRRDKTSQGYLCNSVSLIASRFGAGSQEQARAIWSCRATLEAYNGPLVVYGRLPHKLIQVTRCQDLALAFGAAIVNWEPKMKRV